MSTTCTECLSPCPEHGITYCATCHKHPGECDFGDCQSKATHRLLCKSPNGDLAEIRPLCHKHATAPHFGFLHADGEIEPLEAS
jgi:hypothetical protein